MPALWQDVIVVLAAAVARLGSRAGRGWFMSGISRTGRKLPAHCQKPPTGTTAKSPQLGLFHPPHRLLCSTPCLLLLALGPPLTDTLPSSVT